MRSYIQNKGSSQTIVKTNDDDSPPHFNNVTWDADYDGRDVHLDVEVNENGHGYKVHADLDNRDLAKLLKTPTIEGDLKQRMLNDFGDNESMPLLESLLGNKKDEKDNVKLTIEEDEPHHRTDFGSGAADILKELQSSFPLSKTLPRQKTSRRQRRPEDALFDILKTPSPEMLHVHLTPLSYSRRRKAKKKSNRRRRHSTKKRNKKNKKQRKTKKASKVTSSSS